VYERLKSLLGISPTVSGEVCLQIQDILLRIERLANQPATSEVFGAWERQFGHHFERSAVSREDLAKIETRLGLSLPVDYCELLRAVGSKIGPYYGLFSPEMMIREIADLTFPEDGKPASNPAKDFPISSHDLIDLHGRAQKGSDVSYINSMWPSDGCVPICFQGCQSRTALVTAGEFSGTVWDVACYEGWNGAWVPARRAPGILALKPQKALPDLPSPPTLLQWYEAWLERVEVDVCHRSTDPPFSELRSGNR
jgi:hypothetical protein